LAHPQNPQKRDFQDRDLGMMHSELEILRSLAAAPHTSAVLEVGMANGSSTEVMLSALAKKPGGGRLISVDPFQLVPKPQGFGGEAVDRIRKAGLAAMHTLDTRPDYLALPDFVAAGQKFDLIFIDGYHSVDYCFMDAFYADLLLKPGGTLAFHDCQTPAIHKVCRFTEANGRYRLMGPPLAISYKNVARRVGRRLWYSATGRAKVSKARREEWKTLAAFTKVADGMTPEFEAPGL